MKDATHIRDGKRIMRASDGNVETFPSITKAKHRSRELLAGGAVVRLGQIVGPQSYVVEDKAKGCIDF